MKPQRWLPALNSTGQWKAVMAVPIIENETITKYRVWADESPERDGAVMEWKAETFRRYFKPEKDGHD